MSHTEGFYTLTIRNPEHIVYQTTFLAETSVEVPDLISKLDAWKITVKFHPPEDTPKNSWFRLKVRRITEDGE